MPAGKLIGQRLLGLDIVRASAILMVLLCHYSLNYWTLLASQPTPRMLQVAGLFGVQLFFALSGYLIGNILLSIVERGVTMDAIWRFWARRWLRTLPCYYLAIVIAVWANNLNGFSDYHLWPYLTLSQNLLGQPGQFLGVTWSLTIEEWFYFVFPLLLLPMVALSRRHGMLVALSLVIILSALGRPIAWEKYGFDGLSRTVLFQLDSIAYGALTALIVRGRVLSDGVRQITAIVGVALFAGCWCYLLFGGDSSLFFMSNGIFIGTAVSGSLIVVGFAGLMSAPNVVARPAKFLSIHSYTLYLVHMEMVIVASHTVYSNGLPSWLIVILGPLGGFALSMLITRFFEGPIMERRPKQFAEPACVSSGVQLPRPTSA
jgi:peptidoglycan/LPS O-acetylase OafA/YrhL